LMKEFIAGRTYQFKDVGAQSKQKTTGNSQLATVVR